MPAEWAPHERTIVCWPAREAMWRAALRRRQGRARRGRQRDRRVRAGDARRRPRPGGRGPRRRARRRRRRRDPARRLVGARLRARSSSPATRPAPAWTSASTPGARSSRPTTPTRRSPRRVLEHLGEERVDATDLILEGGSIAVDGEGTLITTEQCLLHPTRNPDRSREQIEARLREALGVERIVWLGLGLVEDARHGRPRRQHLRLDRARARAAADRRRRGRPELRRTAARTPSASPRPGIEVVELDVLPRLTGDGPPTVVPYVNFYVANGALIVPVTGAETDARRARSCSSASIPAGRRSRSQAPRWRSAAAGCTASPSRSPPSRRVRRAPRRASSRRPCARPRSRACAPGRGARPRARSARPRPPIAGAR